MNHGDFVVVCADHWEPWIPAIRACGPLVSETIGRHEDLTAWDLYAKHVGRPDPPENV